MNLDKIKENWLIILLVVVAVGLIAVIAVQATSNPPQAASSDSSNDAHVDDHDHEDDEAAHEDDHSEESGEEHAEGGHGHGAIEVGLLGVESGEEVDGHVVEDFSERVKEEAYVKAEGDKLRFIVFGVFFLAVYVSYAKFGDFSKRLRDAIDWYTIGTVTGIIFIFLVIPSGIIITFFYMPTSEGVYDSVLRMTENGTLAFFRNLHNWSSEIFIFLALLHAARTASTKTFMGNRKFIWFTGGLVFVVGWIAFLTGSFMRGDQEALEGFEHMMYSFTLVPLGNYIAEFFSGEFTIIKLTAVHIGVTVFIIALLLLLHVLMRKVYVHVVNRWKKATIYSIVLTFFLVVQSFIMEAPFIRGMPGIPAISGVEITKPPWPIYFLIEGENVFGADAMVAILTVAFLPLVVLPYVLEFLPIDKKKKLQLGEALFYLGVFAMIVISYRAAAGEIIAHIY
jgi:quinol-cytochrome oxidoreductase complex cytochrome b subunit